MADMADAVAISAAVRDGLNRLDIGDFQLIETPERMAYVALVLRSLSDRPEWFPRGKWATIQHIEEQLLRCAERTARSIEASDGG